MFRNMARADADLWSLYKSTVCPVRHLPADPEDPAWAFGSPASSTGAFGYQSYKNPDAVNGLSQRHKTLLHRRRSIFRQGQDNRQPASKFASCSRLASCLAEAGVWSILAFKGNRDSGVQGERRMRSDCGTRLVESDASVARGTWQQGMERGTCIKWATCTKSHKGRLMALTDNRVFSSGDSLASRTRRGNADCAT